MGWKYPLFLHRQKEIDRVYVGESFEFTRRFDQTPPDEGWLIWLLLGGRGCGKTRAGAEWVREKAKTVSRIALIAPTLSDAREVMLEGESGLLNLGVPRERPTYLASRRRLEWPNGAIGQIFSAEDPESLRGPQFGAAWADEFCAWSYPDKTLANLRMGLRLGDKPQLVITTTPKPTSALKALLKTKQLYQSQALTTDNHKHLSEAFLQAMDDQYGGTRWGRQELEGEIIWEREDALWSASIFDHCRVEGKALRLDKVIIAIDPPVTSGKHSDQCGLIVAGRQGSGRLSKCYILHDGTVQGLSPEKWAKAALSLYEAWGADGLIVETNQGGDLVTSVLRSFNTHIPIRTVFATKGKIARAEPVAAFYEQGKVFHAGRFDKLEAELLRFGSTLEGKSPDRADALVWAVSHLMGVEQGRPAVRPL